MRFHPFGKRKRLEHAAAEDIQAYLDEKAADLMDSGVPEAEARLRARREFGNVGLVIEHSRAVWRWGWLERLKLDLRHGLRLMRRSPGFTTVAVLSLALGIGANTAMFGLLDKIAWRTLPVRDPETLQMVGTIRQAKPGTLVKGETSHSYPLYAMWRERVRSFQSLAAAGSITWRDRSAAGDTTWRQGQSVSGNYFETLGVPAALGRTIGPDDDSTESVGGPSGPVAMVSYRYWRSALQSDPAIIGRQINVNGAWLTVVGVTPPGFFGTTVSDPPDLFFPIQIQPALMPDNLLHESRSSTTWLLVLGRLAAGVSESQAKAELEGIYESYEMGRMNAQDRAAHIAGKPLPRSILLQSASRGISPLRARFAEPLEVMLVLVAIVLLIACANIANLLLARGNARQKEIAVRLAIGAGRGRLVRQLLTESALLSLLGGAAGLLVAQWGSRLLLRLLPSGSSFASLEVVPDTRVLAYTSGLALATAVLIGLAPALRATRRAISGVLKQATQPGSRIPRFDLGKGVAAAEIALALPLIAGAGLFIGTLRNLTTLDPGFERQNVLQATIDVDRAQYPRSQWAAVYQQACERAAAIPGVRTVSMASHGLMVNAKVFSSPVHFSGYTFQPGETRALAETYAGPDYFAAAAIPLRMGRFFTERDAQGKEQVAVVNETLARHYFPGQSPIGKRFGFGSDPDQIEIIGVVADAKHFDLRQDVIPMAYYPWKQMMPARLDTLLVRTQGDSAAVAVALRRAITGMNPDLFREVRTLSSQIDETLVRERILAQLSGFFGVLALLLTCIGLYGVIAYGVTRRTQEIGVRIALGAVRSEVIGMVLRDSLVVAGIGIVVGVPIAAGLSKLVASLLYGVRPADPWMLGGAVLALIVVSLAAGFFPARQAARVDPMTALRYE